MTASGSIGNNLLSGGDGNDFLDISGTTSGYGESIVSSDSSSGNNTLNGGAGDDTLTARNLQLSENGKNLEISFDGVNGAPVILQNFALENLDNLSLSPGATVNLGNIVFDGQTSITDSFDVFNANSTQSTIFQKNTVTFLNDLNNNVNGFDNSNDVINGQGGDDIIDGKSGNDLLRGDAGNDTLIGGMGNNTLNGDAGDDNLNAESSSGNNTLNGGIGDDTLNAESSLGNNLLSGGDGNDSLDISGYIFYNGDPIDNTSKGNNTLNGGAGDDILTASGSSGNNLLFGDDGNDYLSIAGDSYYDTLSGSGLISFSTGNNTLDGGAGNDTLTASGSSGNNLLSGGDGNDSLYGSAGFDAYTTLNGGAGDDTLTGGGGKDVLTGGGGKDKFVYNDLDDRSDTITDFGGVGKGANPTAGVIAEVDTLIFQGDRLTARNLQLSENGKNLEISFDGVNGAPVILQNFALENLDNLSLSPGATVNLGNIVFDGQTSITDSFDVFNANSTQSTIFQKNTVTFLNDLNNNVNGFDNSNDVINGQGGDDIIQGLSGNDMLRGGAGNDSLFGEVSLIDPYSTRHSNDSNDTLDGGAGDDYLSAYGSLGNNLLSGGDGNDSLNTSGSLVDLPGYSYPFDNTSEGNNTLNGGAGNDILTAYGSSGNNLLFGDDGNDYLDISGSSFFDNESGEFGSNRSFGNNTLNGGAGNDTLTASGSTGNNLLSGGDGNDYLTGGNGTDTFAFDNSQEGVDSLYDFNPTNDLIQVSADGFGGELSTPSLSANQFTIGTSATTSEERFIYNDITGALFFDLDGSASGFTQVKFAQLSTGLSLTQNNFVVV